MNKAILLGRLTKDPEIRYSQTNNMMVANFTLAVNRKYAKAGEERQTDFINIVAFSKLAEFVQKYLKRGIQICVCGRIQTRTYEDKNNQTHYVTEIVAEDIDFADSFKKVDNTNILNSNPINQITDEIMGDDDLPF